MSTAILNKLMNEIGIADEEEEIDNILGPWRLIVEEDSNVQGWVFGGYVRFDQ